MYSYESESMFECSKTFSIVFLGLILMTAGFCLTMAGWFAPPINNFVLGVRTAGPVTLLIGLIILLCSCLMCAVVQRKCCVCCFDFLDRRKARRKRDSAQHIVTNPHNPLIFSDDMQDSVNDCRRMQSEYYFDTTSSAKGRGNGYFRGENTKIVGVSENDEEYTNCMVVRNDLATEPTPVSTPAVKVKVKKLKPADLDTFYDQNDISLGMSSTIHVNTAVASSPRRAQTKSRSNSAERRSKSASPSRRVKQNAAQLYSDANHRMCNGPCSVDKPFTNGDVEQPDGATYALESVNNEWSYHVVSPKSPEQRALELELVRREQELARRERPRKKARSHSNKDTTSIGEVWQHQQQYVPHPRHTEHGGKEPVGLVMDPRLHPNGQQIFRESRQLNNGPTNLAGGRHPSASSSYSGGSPSPKPISRAAAAAAAAHAQPNIVLPKPGQYRERDPNRLTPREQRRRRSGSGDETTPLNSGYHSERLTPDPNRRASPVADPPPSYTDATVVHSNV